MFDRLLLLKSGGFEVYFGNVGKFAMELVEYFENLPIDTSQFDQPMLPENKNPANWMLEVIGAGTGKKLTPDFVSLYSTSELRAQNMKIIETLSIPSTATPLTFENSYQSTYLTQISTVVHRTFVDYWRNVAYNFTRFCTLQFLGILFGLVWFQLDTSDIAGLNSKISAIFTTCAFCGVINSGTALPVLCRNRAIYYRERASNTYTSFAYSFSLGLVELPYVFIGSILFVIPFYFMVGFEHDVNLFFQYLFAHYLVSLCFSYQGQFMASALPNIVICSILQGLLSTFYFLFGGIFIRAPDIPAGWKWIYYVNPVPKCVIALATSQFECKTTNCPSIAILDSTGSVSQMTSHNYVSYVLDTGYGMYWNYIGWLLLTLLIFRVFVSLALHKINHMKR
jgi:ABC-type multidrug transport system permease subunit